MNASTPIKIEHLQNQIFYPIVIPHQSSYPVVIPPPALLIVLLGFAIYPAIYPTPKFFTKREFENVVTEYYYIKKILFVSIIILIIFLSLFLISERIEPIVKKMLPNDETTNLQQQKIETIETLDKELEKELKTLRKNDTNSNTTDGFRSLIQKLNSIYSNDTDSNTSPLVKKFNDILPYSKLTSLLYNSIFFILPPPISIIIKLLIQHSRKLFKLYLARGCFRIVSNKSSDEIDKAKYFMRGLIWYNRFLKNTINLQINNIDKICENMLIKSSLDYNATLLSIAKSFEDEKGFKPLRLISHLLPNAKGEKILTKELLRTKIQDASDLIIPIVTIIITIITTFLFKPFS